MSISSAQAASAPFVGGAFASPPAGAAAADAAAPYEPHTLTWPGSGSSLKDWVTPGLVGAVFGVTAGVSAKLAQNALRHRSSGLVQHPAAPFLAAGLAFLAGTFLAVHFRDAAEKQPPLPSPDDVGALPAAAALPGAPGTSTLSGKQVGRVDGSYWKTERYTETETYRDSDGKMKQRTVTKTRRVQESFNYDIDVRRPVGRMDGYPSLDAALADTRGIGPVVVAREAGRFWLYRLAMFSHWNDIDRMRISNPTIDAVMSPGGKVWVPGYAGGTDFKSTTEIADSDPVDDLHDDKVGSFALDRRMDPDIRLYSLVGPGAGYATLAEALGDATARSGDDAVIARDGRYFVMDTYVLNDPDPTARLRGLRTGGSSEQVAALEVNGEVYVSEGQYWMTPSR